MMENDKPNLNRSELEILKLIAQKKTTREIADIQFKSISNIDHQRKNIMRKLQLSNRRELLKYAIQSKYDF